MTTAALAPGDQALFNALTLPGRINSEWDPINIFTGCNLAFRVEPAKADGFSVHFNEDQVIAGVSGAEVCVF